MDRLFNHRFQSQLSISLYFLVKVLSAEQWWATSLWLQTSSVLQSKEVRWNTNLYDWLTTYEFVCGNSHVSIPSINDGALFGGGCEETREDAIFSCVKGWLELNKFWQGATAVSESWVFSWFFLEYKRAVGFLGFDRLETNTPKNWQSRQILFTWNKSGASMQHKAICSHKKSILPPLASSWIGIFSRLLKIPKPTLEAS